jgi:hypothetical protein
VCILYISYAGQQDEDESFVHIMHSKRLTEDSTYNKPLRVGLVGLQG